MSNDTPIANGAEEEQSSSPFGRLSDSEFSSQDSGDEDLCSQVGTQTKLQFRSVVLKACWKNDMGMAEIINKKGNLLKSMGINRNGKIYLSIEETLFLLQIGALLLVDEEDKEFFLKDMYLKIEEKNGCSWEGFKVYQHLKSLGYIVGRLGVPWSQKNTRSSAIRFENSSENNNASNIAVDKTSIIESLKALQLNGVNPISRVHVPPEFKQTTPEKSNFVVHLPVYEAFLPNSLFKKTCPGDPNVVVYSTSGHPPSLSDLKELERQSNGRPVKIGHVDDGRVSLFSFDEVELPVLP
ncbi:unnamed protein product [Amaranthus hypochondriacus]